MWTRPVAPVPPISGAPTSRPPRPAKRRWNARLREPAGSPVADGRRTHGGRVGAPVGSAGFDPDSECIHGNWEVVRHEKGNSEGNFHAKSYDSLMCACLACPEDPGSGFVIGGLCNPGARTCGPEPRRAPANKICFSGVGDFAESKGGRAARSVLFRVDVEDRSEPGNSHAGGAAPPADRHRIRIWILTDAEKARLDNPNDRLLDFR